MRGLDWSIGFYDADVWGWLIFLGYLGVAGLCAWQVVKGDQRVRVQNLWIVATLILLFLGANKQLDLHNLVRDYGRHLSMQQGWYEHRRLMQAIVIVFGGLGISVCGMAMLRYWQNILHEFVVLLMGFAVLVGYVVFQATAFHHLNPFGRFSDHLIWNILELSGIALIALAATTATTRTTARTAAERTTPRRRPTRTTTATRRTATRRPARPTTTPPRV